MGARCEARGFVHVCICALSLSKGTAWRFDGLSAHYYDPSMIGLRAFTVSIVSASAADLSGR